MMAIVVLSDKFNSEQLSPETAILNWIVHKKELDEYFNPRNVSDDFHDEIGDEDLREEVVDEEALENGTKGDQEAIVVEIIMCIYFTV